MDPRLIEMYKKVKGAYLEAVSTIADIKAEAVTERSAQVHADNAFALNECNKLIEDLGKEVRRLLGLSEKMANMICLQSNDMGPIRTPYVTASLRSKMAASVPPRDSAEYAQLLSFLGIPLNDHVRIHYPTLRDTLTEAIEQGAQIPEGITEMQPEFHLTLRKRREVDAGPVTNEEQLQLDLEYQNE